MKTHVLAIASAVIAIALSSCCHNRHYDVDLWYGSFTISMLNSQGEDVLDLEHADYREVTGVMLDNGDTCHWQVYNDMDYGYGGYDNYLEIYPYNNPREHVNTPGYMYISYERSTKKDTIQYQYRVEVHREPFGCDYGYVELDTFKFNGTTYEMNVSTGWGYEVVVD